MSSIRALKGKKGVFDSRNAGSTVHPSSQQAIFTTLPFDLRLFPFHVVLNLTIFLIRILFVVHPRMQRTLDTFKLEYVISVLLRDQNEVVPP